MRRNTQPAGPAGSLLVRRFLADYARNPVNLLILVLVPAAFVAGAAGSMAQLARLLSGTMAPGSAVQTVTAGWAAAFIAAIAAYFQVRAARSADRRLVLAGLPAGKLAAARTATGLALAALASAAAVITLAARAGIAHPGRVLAGTFMFAVIYLAVGALVGTLVASPVNGTVLIFFGWITDVMFGPVFGSPARLAGRVFPTHFLILWMTGLPPRPAVRPGRRSPGRLLDPVPRPRHRPGPDAPRGPACLGALPARLRGLPYPHRRRPHARLQRRRPAADRPHLAGRCHRRRRPGVPPQHANRTRWPVSA